MISKNVDSDSEECSDENEVISSNDEGHLSDSKDTLEISDGSVEASSTEGSEDGDDDKGEERGSDSSEIDADEDNEDSDGEDDGEDDEEGDDDEEADDDDDDDEEEIGDTDIANDIEVGKGLTAQSKLYSGLLACRLKVQEAVTALNQLPQNEVYNEIVSDAVQFSNAITNTKGLVEKTLNELTNLQDELLSSRDNEKSIADVESESTEINGDTETNGRLHGKRKIENYPELLSKRQKLLNDYRDSTLKAVSTLPIRSSFANFESSTIVQIQQILLDKERLIKRTQLIRSIFPVIGKKVEQEENDVEKASRKQIYDVEIFDDSDFFNKLVTQFTSLKTANFSDMNAVSKQWAELNKLRRNTAAVDRRASKGRKTRYTVHRKLVNFMAPFEDAKVYSDEQRDALSREVFSDQS